MGRRPSRALFRRWKDGVSLQGVVHVHHMAPRFFTFGDGIIVLGAQDMWIVSTLPRSLTVEMLMSDKGAIKVVGVTGETIASLEREGRRVCEFHLEHFGTCC